MRKLKRKAKRQFKQAEESVIDLGLVRGNRDSVKIEQETGRTSGLTCPQLLAISGALGAIPQVHIQRITIHTYIQSIKGNTCICNNIDDMQKGGSRPRAREWSPRLE